jgi:hypothetical protein
VAGRRQQAAGGRQQAVGGRRQAAGGRWRVAGGRRQIGDQREGGSSAASKLKVAGMGEESRAIKSRKPLSKGYGAEWCEWMRK